MNDLRPRWSTQTKVIISLLALAFFIYLLSRFSAVISPLILATILAFVLSPTVNLLETHLHIPRLLATILTYLILITIAVVIPILIVPPLVAQLTILNLDIQNLIQETEDILGSQYHILGLTIDARSIFSQAVTSLQGLTEPFIGRTLGLVVDVISSVVWVIFILVVSFYLIKDGPALRAWFETLPPPHYQEDYIRLRDEISTIWGSFFRGQLILALVVAIIFTSIGFLIGLPFALAMGVLAGLLEFLPSLGHGIWLFLASLLAFFIGSTWLPLPNWIFTLIVIGLHLAYQQFDLNYLIPRIIGHSVHLPPLVVILGIVAGAVLAGILGIPLAAPTIASIRVIGRYVFANLYDLDPFPNPITKSQPEPNYPKWWNYFRKEKRHS
jgi:predicted PurR-regulated permease PerM